MNIEELTIGDARKIAAMFGLSASTVAPVLTEERAVVVTTDKRGVFFGYTKDVTGDVVKLRSARNAFYWSANQGGVLALGSEGPRPGSKIGERADIELRGVTAVIACTPKAVEAWESGQWKA